MLRSVKVYYECGHSYTTSMAAHLTDEQIYNYFSIGKFFNIGTVTDKLSKVSKVTIIK